MPFLLPTRIYVRSILDLLASGAPVHALAHITGGGITENLDRALPRGVDCRGRPRNLGYSPVITYVVEAAGLSQEQALKTFNMGIGMAVICDPGDAVAIRETLELQGERVFEIGTIIASDEGRDAKGKVVYREQAGA